MFRNTSPTLFLLLLSVVYVFLFHHAEMGINLLLFDALLVIAALKARPELAKHQGFVWSVAGLIFAAGSVVIVHGFPAILAHHLTYLLVLGFAQTRELRFVWFGLALGVVSIFLGPAQQWNHGFEAKQQRTKGEISSRWGAMSWVRQAIVPVLVLVPFLLFYLAGNEALSRGLNKVIQFLESLSFDFNPVWLICLFVFGLLLCLPLLFPRLKPSLIVEKQLDFRDELRRSDQKPTLPLRPRPKFSRPSTLSLRSHYRQAVLTFGLLNIVLAIVNTTDLVYVWLPASHHSAATLSHYVHVGTTNLVASILLAMLVVLYYFRGNLNFLKEATAIRPLARLWLAQNAILAVSVGVRNYHYIDTYGLANGRVHVGFMLLLILFGLYTLLRKIDHKLTLSYPLQANGIAAWLLLLAFAAVNWSGVITRYNLATQEASKVDWNHLRYGLDRRNTFLLLDENPARLDRSSKSRASTHKNANWRSWNYPDWRNHRALERRSKEALVERH
jgi:hypothetical protein